MKIVFLDQSTLGDDISLEPFNQFGEVITYATTTQDEILNRIQNVDIVVTNKVVINKEIMDNSSLKLICVAATGMNNIDLEYAKQKGIEVKNAVGYSTASVVQLTFAYVLHFMQKLNYFDDYVKSKQWENSAIFTNVDVPFNELENKKWGIIGMGNIGKKVASIAQSFGCEVSYYSTSGANTNTDYNLQDLNTLLKESDIVSVHCPLNDTTLNLINKTNLKLIKDGAIILNLGRGGIINEKDLAHEINSRKLYCGVDVVTKEPIEKANPLNDIRNKDQIVITPHIAWASKESRERLIGNIVNNIKEFVL
ncbi:MAG: D-2-hydroxyacid dehydrogenase [Campylobacterota bacterium]|nr:D-2-hydroxyacid dehydrogenase [Campylobacterota bacterium]